MATIAAIMFGGTVLIFSAFSRKGKGMGQEMGHEEDEDEDEGEDKAEGDDKDKDKGKGKGEGVPKVGKEETKLGEVEDDEEDDE